MNRVLVTGGAGFVGSHLCRALLDRGDRVIVVDDFSTGRHANIAGLTTHPHFVLRTADTTTLGCFAGLDRITHLVHLAYPGSPDAAARYPAAALRAASTGALAALDLAAAHNARVVLASGPGLYSNAPGHPRPAAPDVHAAGHLLMESAVRTYHGVDTGIVRLPDVYGPRLWPGDGRITATICAAALRDQTLYLAAEDTLYPVYVTDAVDAVLRLLDSDTSVTIEIASFALPLGEFARKVIGLAGRGWVESHHAAPPPAVPPANPSATHRCRPTTTCLDCGVRDTLDWMHAILTDHGTP